MAQKEKIKEFLTNDDGLVLLKTIDILNPMSLPTSKLCTIKTVSDVMGKSLKDTWHLIDDAYMCSLVVFYGGLLSRKRVDLTDLGESFCDCVTPADIGDILNGIHDDIES